MKTILLIGIFLIFRGISAQIATAIEISAQKTITCKVSFRASFLTDVPEKVCTFEGVVIDQNETLSIKVVPENEDVYEISWVDFLGSQIYSIPTEVFEKFPNLKGIIAPGSDIQEIKPGTFAKATNLEVLDLANNRLSYLHPDTFKGKQFSLVHLIINV
jgi:hypothetical protein